MLSFLLVSLAWGERTPIKQQVQIAHLRAQRLTIKFHDHYRVRANKDGTVAVNDDYLQQVVAQYDISFSQLISLPEQVLLSIEERAFSYSLKAQPDLAAMMVVHTPEDVSLLGLVEDLQKATTVEYVNVENIAPPPPGDIAPITDDFTPLQSYLFDGDGVAAAYLWGMGRTGSNVRLADIEYGWNLSHEDLIDQEITFESDQTTPNWVESNGWDVHGTASIGVTSAVSNGYGCTGIVHEAPVFLYPEFSEEEGSRRATAIAQAMLDLQPGDVLLLEMQDYGAPSCGTSLSCLVPAEVNPDVWTMTRMAVDAGIVVVAAAGNGGQDLDTEWYVNNYLSFGDSGAIIVGGGTPDQDHAPIGMTYGSRVNVHGWAYGVYTLGYRFLPELNYDPNQTYTPDFSGTSSASAMVSGAVALLQDWAWTELGYPLSPEGIRNVLIDSGTPQTGAEHIGPLPNLANAVALLSTADADGDGEIDSYYGGSDCNDTDVTINAAAQEIWYDGIDQNCDGLSDYDADYDGFERAQSGGLDCDDSDPLSNPNATEVWYDGIDQNCDGLSDYDFDLDGDDHLDYGGGDCNDEDVSINGFVAEVWYDGIDQNCDNLSDYDADYDGDDHVEYGGSDCNDEDDSISGLTDEIWYDGIDQNCDGLSDYDADYDGFESNEHNGADCDDGRDDTYPGATEVLDDDIDQNCDGILDKSAKQGCATVSQDSLSSVLWLALMAVLCCRRRRRL